MSKKVLPSVQYPEHFEAFNGIIGSLKAAGARLSEFPLRLAWDLNLTVPCEEGVEDWRDVELLAAVLDMIRSNMEDMAEYWEKELKGAETAQKGR